MNDKARRHLLGRRHRWFRKWHRWIGFGGGLFLIFAAVTGFLVAFTEFFGPAERTREANRKITSEITTSTPIAQWQDPMARAVAEAEKRAPASPIDRISIELKGAQPRIRIFTGKRGGGEDRQFMFWALSLFLLGTSGLYIYLTMRRRDARGMKRVFW